MAKCSCCGGHLDAYNMHPYECSFCAPDPEPYPEEPCPVPLCEVCGILDAVANIGGKDVCSEECADKVEEEK